MAEKQGSAPSPEAELKALTLLRGVVRENSRYLRLESGMLRVSKQDGTRYLVELRTARVYDERGKFICLRVLHSGLPVVDQVIAKSIYLLNTPDPIARAYHNMLFKVAFVGVRPAIEWPWMRSMAYVTLGQDFSSLIGVDFAVKEIRLTDLAVKLQMWYIDYTHKFKPIRAKHLHGSSGGVIVCSQDLRLVEADSLQASINELYLCNGRRLPMIFVGLRDERENLLRDSTGLEIGERMANENDIPFFVCSLNHPSTTEKPLAYLTELILQRQSCA